MDVSRDEGAQVDHALDGAGRSYGGRPESQHDVEAGKQEKSSPKRPGFERACRTAGRARQR
jgi:hypothetical protein